MARTPPRGYELVTDVNERVQRGDLVWHEDEADWEESGRAEIGDYAHGFHAVARKMACAPKLIRRTRPSEPQ